MDNYGQVTRRIGDDSFIITKNGMPYHVPNNREYAEEWRNIFNYAETHPEMVTEEEPYSSPVPTVEDFAASIRAERDRRLTKCAWIVERHRDQLAGGRETTLTDAEYQSWLIYRQALRDLPQQGGFPWEGPDDPACPWPVEPTNE